MNRSPLTLIAGGLAAAALLSACGGGSDDDPLPTPLDSSVTISAATNATLAGVYSTGTTGLSDVDKENPIGAPQFCSYRFNSLSKVGSSSVLLDGRIAYNVNQDLVNNLKVSVGGVTYGTGDTASTFVDKQANIVSANNKVLISEADGTSTITVTLRVPVKASRPDGC